MIGVALLGTVELAATALYIAVGDVAVLSWSARAAVNVAVPALIPGDRILMETQSTNTEENLLFTEEVLQEAGLVDPALLIVTSNFHVLRSVSLSRQLRLRVSALGSVTPSYYLPSAFLREFAALVVHYRWANVLVWLAFTALWAVPLIFM